MGLVETSTVNRPLLSRISLRILVALGQSWLFLPSTMSSFNMGFGIVGGPRRISD